MQELPVLDSTFTAKLAAQLGVDAAASIRKFDGKVQQGLNAINKKEREEREEAAAEKCTPEAIETTRQRHKAASVVRCGIQALANQAVASAPDDAKSVPFVHAEIAINEAEKLLRTNGLAPLALANKRLVQSYSGRLISAFGPIGFKPSSRSKIPPSLAPFVEWLPEEGLFCLNPATWGLDFASILSQIEKDMINDTRACLHNIILASDLSAILADRFPNCKPRPAWVFNHFVDHFLGKIDSDPEAKRMFLGWRKRLVKQGITGIGDGEQAPSTDKSASQPHLEQQTQQQQGVESGIENEISEENNNNFSPFYRPGGM